MSVVIPTWNGYELLAQALESLASQTWRDFEIIAVDNGSCDGTVQRLGRAHPEVRLVPFAENRGFAVAVNAGIRAAGGEIIVLMNNDVEAAPGWLAALVHALDTHPEVGSCASKMLDLHDRGRIDSAGDELGVYAFQYGHGKSDGPQFSRPRYAMSACAGAAAYRRPLFDQVGFFDERFFAYLEDVDFGVRSQLAGYDCLYVPDAVVYHRGSATSRKQPALKFYLVMRNTLIVFFQYMPLPKLIAWMPLALMVPFVAALDQRQPLRLAAKSVLGFLRELPNVLRQRRRVWSTRRISTAEFSSRLANPRAVLGSRHRPARPPLEVPCPAA